MEGWQQLYVLILQYIQKGNFWTTGLAGEVDMLICPNATFILQKNRSTNIVEKYKFL